MLIRNLIFFTLVLTLSSARAEPEPQIEFLMVGKTVQAVESFFGHTALMVIPAGKNWQQGQVVHFAAMIGQDSQGQQYFKGLTGQYEFRLLVQTPEIYFYEKLIQEGRSVDRYPLLLSKEVKNRLLHLVNYYQKRPEALGSYYFTSRNCASMMAWLLKQAGAPIPLRQINLQTMTSIGFTPDDLLIRLDNSLFLPWPAQHMESLKARYERITKKYNLNFGSEYDDQSKAYSAWSSEQLGAFQKMSLEELQIVIQSVDYTDTIRFEILNKIIQSRKVQNFLPSLDWINYKTLDPALYNICSDKACMEQSLEAYQRSGERVKGSDERNKINRLKLRRTKQLLLPIDPAIQRHWEFY